MSEVDEAMMIIFRMIGGTADLLKQGLQITGSIIGNAAIPTAGVVGKAVGGVVSKPLEAGKNFVQKNVPHVGQEGQVSAKALNAMDGDTICVGEFADDELKLLKKELKKEGVDFAAIKDRKEGVDSILVKAKNAQLAQTAMAKVARKMNLLSEQEIKEACEPQINEDVIKQEPKLLEDAKETLSIDGQEWSLSQNDGLLEYTCECGMYDLKANSNGEWEVSKMGEVKGKGRNVAGLKSAMLEARATTDDMEHPKHERVKVVESPTKKAEASTLQKNKEKSQGVGAKKERPKRVSPTEHIAAMKKKADAHNASMSQKRKTPSHSKGAR